MNSPSSNSTPPAVESTATDEGHDLGLAPNEAQSATPAEPDPASDITPAPSSAPSQLRQLSPLGAGLVRALDGPYHETRQRYREEMTVDDLLRDPGQTLPEARAWVREQMERLAARGHGRVGFPVEYGGDGEMATSALSFEALAHGDLSLTVKSGVHWGLFGGALVGLGTDWHYENFVPDTMSMAVPGCFAMTEVGHGSDVQSLETRITYDPAAEEFVVHSPTPSATKTYIGGAGEDAQIAAVFGQLTVDGTDHGIHAILVPIRDSSGALLPGVTTGDNGHKGGLAGVDNGTLSFDQVRVPRRMLLDRYGGVDETGSYVSSIDSPGRRFFTMLGTLVRGRICVGAGGAVAARRGLSIAVRYAERRRQFTAPGHDGEVTIMDYLAHQRKLLPRIATAYAFGFANNEVIRSLQDLHASTASGGKKDQRAQRELETRAAGMKAAQTAFANETLQVCREACGGAGYMAENQLTLLRADADVFATFEGDNTVLLQLVAKGLLTDYKEMWGDLDMFGMVQAAARTFGSAVIERTAARPVIERLVAATRSGGSDEERLLDRGWHLSMFEERERHVLESLAQRMRTVSKAGDTEDAFEMFNKTQDHLLMAARVHIDRVVLEAFVAGIEACTDEDVSGLLEQVCDLYALSSIAADRDWFQEHNRMSAARAKAIVPAINQLCGELRPRALDLVEGLGIPEAWLGAALLED